MRMVCKPWAKTDVWEADYPKKRVGSIRSCYEVFLAQGFYGDWRAEVAI